MRIKLLLLGLLTPLLFGVSFGFNPLSNFDNTPNNVFNSVGSLSYNIVSGKQYCVYVEYSNNGGSTYSLHSYISVPRGCYDYSTSVMGNENFYCFNACSSQSNFNFISPNNSQDIVYRLYEFDTPISVGEDCSSIQSQLETCSNALSGTSANLSQCQSDLSSCSNSCDTLVNQCLNDKSILSGNLASCNEDKSSLQNYNESLSSQLNECLMSGTGGVGSGVFLSSFDIFWQDGNDNYSLPITNNLFLPYGYKGKLNEGVLSIAKNNSLEYAYSIDDESYQVGVIDMLGKVFVFLVSCGLFLVFLYAIRRYFIGLKSIK